MKQKAFFIIFQELSVAKNCLIFESEPLSSTIQRVICFDNTSVASSLSEKLFGITLDSELKFEEDINKICNIFNKELSALHRIARTKLNLNLVIAL